MPRYEFECLRCHKEFMLTLTLSEHDKAEFVCPHCKATEVERLVTTAEVITSSKS